MFYSLELVNIMLNNPSLDINLQDKFGVNSFWITAYYGHAEILRRLMDRGINIFCKNQNGSNGLHISVKKENKQIV